MTPQQSDLFVIDAKGPGLGRTLRELARYGELVGFFVWRSIRVRYKQTAIGAAWAILQPALTMLVFTLFFGQLARLPSDGLAYPVFFLGGLVPWTFFANAITGATNVLVDNSRVITRVYFPRLALPISTVLSFLVDLAITSGFLIVMVALLGPGVGPQLLAFPVFVLLVAILAVGLGTWTSALNARFRDVRFAIPVVMQVWLFASPVAYSAALVPTDWRWLYDLNPMVAIVTGFRWATTGGAVDAPSGASVLSCVTAATILLVTGTAYFTATESEIVDVV